MNGGRFLAGDCIDLRQRTEFAESVQRLLQKRREEARAARDTLYRSRSRESLRKNFIDMLGWPLNDPGACRGAVNCRREALHTDGDFIMERLQLDVLPDFWFYGILFKPVRFSPEKKYVLVIAQHGGRGSPAIVGGILPQQPDGGNYNWADWTYFKQAHTFFDAETAALVYPRAGYSANVSNGRYRRHERHLLDIRHAGNRLGAERLIYREIMP